MMPSIAVSLLLVVAQEGYAERAFGADFQRETQEARQLIGQLQAALPSFSIDSTIDQIVRRLIVLDYSAEEALRKTLETDPNPRVRAVTARILVNMGANRLDAYLGEEKDPAVRYYLSMGSRDELYALQATNSWTEPERQNFTSFVSRPIDLSNTENSERIHRMVRLLGDEATPGFGRARHSARASNEIVSATVDAFPILLEVFESSADQALQADLLWLAHDILDNAELAIFNGEASILPRLDLPRFVRATLQGLDSASERIRHSALEAALSLVYVGEDSVLGKIEAMAKADSSAYLRKEASKFLTSNWKKSDYYTKLHARMREECISESETVATPTEARHEPTPPRADVDSKSASSGTLRPNPERSHWILPILGVVSLALLGWILLRKRIAS